MLFALSPIFAADRPLCTGRYSDETAAVEAANRLRQRGVRVRVRLVDGRGQGGDFTGSSLLIPLASPAMRRAA